MFQCYLRQGKITTTHIHKKKYTHRKKNYFFNTLPFYSRTVTPQLPIHLLSACWRAVISAHLLINNDQTRQPERSETWGDGGGGGGHCRICSKTHSLAFTEQSLDSLVPLVDLSRFQHNHNLSPNFTTSSQLQRQKGGRVPPSSPGLLFLPLLGQSDDMLPLTSVWCKYW